MILLLAAVLLVLLVGLAIVGGATGLAGERKRSGEGFGIGAALAVPVAVAAGLVVLFVVMVFGLGGARSARDPANDTDFQVVGPAPEPREPVALEGPPASFDGRVSIHQGASPLRPLPIVGGLAAGDVVEVSGVGFRDHAEGLMAQCSNAEARVCRNVAPIITDGEGRLRMPYRVEGETSGGVIVVEVDFARGAARLGFGATAISPATLTVTDGAMAAIRGASPGERVEVRRCHPGATAVEDCSRVVNNIIVAADGTASVPLDAASGDDARLTLVDAAGNVLAEPILVEATPGLRADVDLDPRQLLIGFSLALALLAIAITLIRTTDWRVPAEAATPLLDAAPL